MTIESELCDFLERLGMAIEERSPNEVAATRRTAFRQEQIRFLISDGTRVPRRRRDSILLVPSGSPPPRSYKGEWFYFENFLDSAIQADRIGQETAELNIDPVVKGQLTAFVPQHIAEAGNPAPKDAVKYFFEDWLPDEQGRLLVVLAPAGYGKTLLTYELARRLAESHLASTTSPRKPLPFLVPFAKFRRVADFESMILAPLQKSGVTDFTAGAFAYLVTHNRVVLFLDGFDELLEERPTEAQKNLRELIETLQGQGKVIVTARSTFFRTSLDVADFLEHFLAPDEVKVLDLQPFDANQRATVVAKLTPNNQSVVNRITRVVESQGIREAMGSPLLLRETIEALKDEHRDVEIKPSASRRDLFPALESSIYARERRRHAHDFSNSIQRSMLRILAGDLFRNNTRGFEMDLVRVAATEAVRDSETTEAELEKLADHHFLTADPGAQDVRFNHQVFREYFQALALLEAVKQNDMSWVSSAFSRRPIPEEVAVFLSELAANNEIEQLIALIAEGEAATESLVNNIGAVALATKSRSHFERFLQSASPSWPLRLRIRGLQLDGIDFRGRWFADVQFAECSLVKADFSDSVMQEVGFHACDLTEALFERVEPQSATFDYRTRLFGRLPIFDALEKRGALCGKEFAEQVEVLVDEWRTIAHDVVKGRLQRLYLPGPAGPEGSRWDTSFEEKRLLRGIDPPTRTFIATAVIPRMLSLGILSRHREHGSVIYRLEDSAKDDARALVESDEEIGVMAELIDDLVQKYR